MHPAAELYSAFSPVYRVAALLLGRLLRRKQVENFLRLPRRIQLYLAGTGAISQRADVSGRGIQVLESPCRGRACIVSDMNQAGGGIGRKRHLKLVERDG